MVMIHGNTVLRDAASLRAKPTARFRAPRPEDAHRVWKLIEETPSLDKNSLYCNLLQCSHFAPTCAVAEIDGALVGWLSGYLPPGSDDTLFVWQVCVSQRAQGQGIARKLIAAVLARASSTRVRYLACTITEDNTASWGLFGSVARALKAQMRQAEHFLRDTHFDGGHDSELAVSIGPFTEERVADLSA
jgi:L-2,4-diaminobutyric acid acetyltransferase